MEELQDGDSGIADGTEITRPDEYEEHNSDKSESAVERKRLQRQRRRTERNLIHDFQDLCVESPQEATERGHDRLRGNRMSGGIVKRSHSQSVGHDEDFRDSEDPEALDGHDIGGSARRLRRRVRGPGDRRSLN